MGFRIFRQVDRKRNVLRDFETLVFIFVLTIHVDG